MSRNIAAENNPTRFYDVSDLRTGALVATIDYRTDNETFVVTTREAVEVRRDYWTNYEGGYLYDVLIDVAWCVLWDDYQHYEMSDATTGEVVAYGPHC